MLPRRTLAEHFNPAILPKRILSLDGGGVRGILTLQYLANIETLLRTRYKDPDLVLSDYFDLIGGTSTGAIIAAGLVLGFDVAKLQTLYKGLAERIFKKPFFRFGAFVPKFGDKTLKKELQNTYKAETKLGSEALKTGLMIMTKRMDTGSPWPITNHPDDPYFKPVEGKKRIGHTNMLLWQIVRASTAAPHYFRPEDVVVGSWLDVKTGTLVSDSGQFVDGGVSAANNPSLQLLKVALLKGFSFKWSTGEDNLLLVSVGTGLRSRFHGRPRGLQASAGAFAFSSLLSIMDDCNREVETVMQWLSKSPTARSIDGQIKSLDDDLLCGVPLLRYLRYNIQFDSSWMKEKLNETRNQSALNDLAQMDRPKNMDELAKIGQSAARLQVKDIDFLFDSATAQTAGSF